MNIPTGADISDSHDLLVSDACSECKAVAGPKTSSLFNPVLKELF